MSVPDPQPERALQFGTGALLRGLIDCYLDAANRRGSFRGSVVAVGSTRSGRDRLLNEQEGLYTLAIQGNERGQAVQEYRLISAVSRALCATDQWSDVLACARNPALEVIFSNTTEVGIALDPRDAQAPEHPRSFPGRLTRLLHERARTFDFSEDSGVVVLPCELIERNGEQLREIVLRLATQWALGKRFIEWIERGVPFCNTLVDRIVTGEPTGRERAAVWDALGYRDELLTCCEPYGLFAIEAPAEVEKRLAFRDADPGIVVAPDIAMYRERKVRLLNGAHTLLAPLGLLCGCETVGQAMFDERLGLFTRQLLETELVPGLATPDANGFAREVLERFSNPYLQHPLIDITLQQSTKMRMRVVPSIRSYAARTGTVPAAMALGFAAFLYHAWRGPATQRRADDGAERLQALWRGEEDVQHIAFRACSDTELWGTDLTCLPGFVGAVGENLHHLAQRGVHSALEAHLAIRR